jgi:DNA-binding MarR family transcriptional regulator
MYGVTKQQLKALDFIDRQTRESGGVCPSNREIAEGIGLSLGATNKLIAQLVQRGRLRRMANRHRTLEVVLSKHADTKAKASCEMLVRHYRACDVSDVRIVGLTDLSPDFVFGVHGAQLLSENVLASLRSQPGVP